MNVDLQSLAGPRVRLVAEGVVDPGSLEELALSVDEPATESLRTSMRAARRA
jgi:hypothetical protein